MLGRIRQVIAAITAKILPTDMRFLNDNLSYSEKKLFYAMNLPDQRHVLNVAYTVIKLAKEHRCVDEQLLVKCALLHDVGKICGDVSTADKVIAILADKFVPRLAKKWGRQGRAGKIANLRHALYIYYHHSERGAEMLKQIGATEKLVEIVKKHHLSPSEGDSIELLLLQKADDLN